MRFLILLILPILILGISGVAEADAQIDPERIIFHVRGPDSLSWIGVSMWSLGDINGDGYDDIALRRNSPFGVFIFYGGNPADTIPDAFYDSCSSFQCSVDFTGDGINDGVSYIQGNLNTNGLYFYRGYADSLATAPFDSLVPDTFVNDTRSGNAYKIGLIDDDNYPDVVIYEDMVIGRFLRFYSGYLLIDREHDWSYELPSSHRLIFIEIIDFNGDGHKDICYSMFGYVWGHVGFIGVFLGPEFGTEPDFIIQAPEEYNYDMDAEYFPMRLKNIGDFNGDSWEDIGISLSMYNSDILIYFCGPSVDTLLDLKMEYGANSLASAGDINNDGFNDLICNGRRSNNTLAYIYLGGPSADSIPDEAVYHQDLPPEFSSGYCNTVSAAGDFNGDGIDDFMFNYVDSDDRTGAVFVIAGSEDIMNNVDENGIGILPNTLSLKQNFPNPFNPATIIEFFIPKRSHVELRIYNMLGETVAIPISMTLTAGIHQIIWDGTDSNGNRLPSGIYFYSVKSDNHSETKKMILLK
ncbi:MAG: T9SS type A sorting domain-containing protein [candidate division Zixibacteria bacterium]